MSTTTTPVDNGIDIDFLRGAREALTAEPAGAQFTWRVSNTWVHGTHSQTQVQGFFGLGEEQDTARDFRFESDHPEVFSSENKGATPVEILLASLASCLTGGIAAVATHRDIQLRSVRCSIEGQMDVRGILGIDTDVRNGFSGITVTYEVDADASRSDVEALVAQSQKRSAVFDILTNPTIVSVKVA